MSKENDGAPWWLLLVLFAIAAAWIVPLVVFSTSPYYCLVFNPTRDELLQVYESQGRESKVWVESVEELKNDVWYLELRARSFGGENDIDRFLGFPFELNFHRLND